MLLQSQSFSVLSCCQAGFYSIFGIFKKSRFKSRNLDIEKSLSLEFPSDNVSILQSHTHTHKISQVAFIITYALVRKIILIISETPSNYSILNKNTVKKQQPSPTLRELYSLNQFFTFSFSILGQQWENIVGGTYYCSHLYSSCRSVVCDAIERK